MLKNQYIGLLLNIKIVSDNIDTEKKQEVPSDAKCLLVINKGKKIPRNELCPATNKKFKNCCGSL